MLAAALLMLAALLPGLLAFWVDQIGSQALPSLVPVPIGSAVRMSQLNRPTPLDVLPANQAGRAPPTFLAALLRDEPVLRVRRS